MKFVGYSGRNLKDTGIITVLDKGAAGYYLKFSDESGSDVVFVPELLVAGREFTTITGDGDEGEFSEMITTSGRIGLVRNRNSGEVDIFYSMDPGVGGGGGAVFTFQPEGVTDVANNVYNTIDFGLLVTALNARAPLPRTFFVDISASSIADGDDQDIPVATLRGDNLHVISTLCDGALTGTLPQGLNFLDGFHFTVCSPTFETCTAIGNNSGPSGPVFTCPAGELCIFRFTQANIKNEGAASFFDASLSSGWAYFGDRSDTNGGSGIIVDAGALSGFNVIFAAGASNLDTDAFKNTNGAVPLFQGVDPSVTIMGSYSNWAGSTTTGFGRFGSRFSALSDQVMFSTGTSVTDAINALGSRLLIYKPGGVTSGNVYATETPLNTAIAAVSGPGIVVLDGSSGGGVLTFAATPDVEDWALIGEPTSSPRPIVTWSPTSAANQPERYQNVSLEYQRTSGVVGNIPKQWYLDNSRLRNTQGSNPQLDSLSSGSTIYASNGTTIEAGSGVLIQNGGGTLTINLYDTSTLDLAAIDVTGGAFIIVNVSPGASVSGSASGAGTVTINHTHKAEKINAAGLTAFADDTAAGGGGLVAGNLYRTGGAVMVKL